MGQDRLHSVKSSGELLVSTLVGPLVAPWCSGQACWPLEPATAVRIRSGLWFESDRGQPPTGPRASRSIDTSQQHPINSARTRPMAYIECCMCNGV
jgi:hypothetical protein